MGFRSEDFDPLCCLRYQAMHMPYWMPHNAADANVVTASTTVSSMTSGVPLTLNAASQFIENGFVAFPGPHLLAFAVGGGAVKVLFEFVIRDWMGKRLTRRAWIETSGAASDFLYALGPVFIVESVTPIDIISGGTNTITLGLSSNVNGSGAMTPGGFITLDNQMASRGLLGAHVKAACVEQLVNFPSLNLQPDDDFVPAPYVPRMGSTVFGPGSGAALSGRATIVCDPNHF